MTDLPPNPGTTPMAVRSLPLVGRRITRKLTLAVVAVVGLTGCSPAGAETGSMLRGDEAFARGDLPDALAEYRLALRQGDRTAPLLARTAHAYTATGRITDAIEHYREAVVVDSTFADLAATDLLKFARTAIEGDDGLQASEAVVAAMVLKPGVSLDGIALPLARHLVRTGRYTQALPFFEQASSETDNSPEVLYELALAYDEAGQCASALALFERAWRRLSVAQRADADWRTGSCSMRLGAEALAEGDLDRALAYFEATVQLGEPRGQVPEAWFRRGEILVLKADCAAALRAFEQVLGADPPPNLRQRAEDQIERLRFERGSFGAC